MLEFKFKIRETTRNGRLLKDLFKTDDDVCCRIPLSKVCGKCCDEVDDQSKIVNCFICKNNYHASCLTHTLSPDCLSALTANPHLWWFCAACTTTSEVAHGEQKSAPDQVDIMNTFNEQFSVLKNELMLNMNDCLLKKLSSVVETRIVPALFGLRRALKISISL